MNKGKRERHNRSTFQQVTLCMYHCIMIGVGWLCCVPIDDVALWRRTTQLNEFWSRGSHPLGHQWPGRHTQGENQPELLPQGHRETDSIYGDIYFSYLGVFFKSFSAGEGRWLVPWAHWAERNGIRREAQCFFMDFLPLAKINDS